MRIEKLENGLYKFLIDYQNGKAQVELIDDLTGLRITAHNMLEKLDRYEHVGIGDEQIIRIYTLIKVPNTPENWEAIKAFEEKPSTLQDIQDFLEYRKEHPKEE